MAVDSSTQYRLRENANLLAAFVTRRCSDTVLAMRISCRSARPGSFTATLGTTLFAQLLSVVVGEGGGRRDGELRAYSR